MNEESSNLSRKIKEEEMISLDALAELTGFPETIKEELLRVQTKGMLRQP